MNSMSPRQRNIVLIVVALVLTGASFSIGRLCAQRAPQGSALTSLAAVGAQEQAVTSIKLDLGNCPDMKGWRAFPDDDPWNKEVAKSPVDPDSDKFIDEIGADKPVHPDFGTVWNGAPLGIPYVVISGNTPKVKLPFTYKEDSDPGPYPIPPDVPIEGGPKATGDRHVIIIDRDNLILYELFNAFPLENGQWKADGGAIFDLKQVSYGQRPMGSGSADAAGLPIFPGLVRYDEVVLHKQIRHALRFTVQKTRKAYVSPASHYASRRTEAIYPPMGMRVRLKADFDISGFPAGCQVVLQAMKTYGMILADNGSNWFISGSPDPRWNDLEMHELKRVKGGDFEVVKMGGVTTH